jgi:hypothetical protein
LARCGHRGARLERGLRGPRRRDPVAPILLGARERAVGGREHGCELVAGLGARRDSDADGRRRAFHTIVIFSPIGRFWELTAGSILALLVVTSPRPAVWLERNLAAVLKLAIFEPDSGVDPDRLYRRALSTLGMAMILTSVFAITRRSEFPGWHALLPVLSSSPPAPVPS